ncbi:MAG: TetR family transcriptional regulator [Actinomycetota bacterium]|nr:TetR family transcriptional regulator [Actinomycetota bacterium]
MIDTAAKIEARAALLDAAERLLISTGYAEISTRRLAEEAGVNHGLVHYYFGSMDELFAQVLERFTERLIARQRAMYARDVPFLEKWRTAMSYLDEDLESGYQKVWLELQALAWNKPALRDRVVHVDEEWRAVVTEAIQGAVEAYDIDTDTFPVEAIVSLVATFNLGMILERHSGVSTGHRELLAAIDSWLQTLDVGVRS